jgi:acetyl esterase/lipase
MPLVLFTIAAILAALCMWIVVPPPVGPAIVASVVGIELSPYLLLLNLAVLVAAFRSRTRLKIATVALAGLNVVLCALPMAAIVSSGLELASPIASPADGQFIESAIPFTLGRDHTAILAYLPTAGTRNPIVFTIYGGAWQRGAPAKDASLDRALAAAGYAVFALEYRHAPEYRFPVALHDIQSEVSSILNNADAYGADRTRAAILGHSSGGQLAELCAFAPGSQFRALISYSGAIDLLKGYEILPRPDPLDVRSVIAAYMGFTPVGHAAPYRAASPIYQVRPGLPPTLLIYGDRDHVVDFGYAQTFRDALRANGDSVTFVELPWAEHGYEEVSFGLHAPIALRAVEDFLQRTLRHD